ncbi:MAG: glycosyltransferase family 2 protein [Planctomycetaceae bacterium]|nr:glycosyltransferase family 2 protein [Planctomycetaceae bacterium]
MSGPDASPDRTAHRPDGRPDVSVVIVSFNTRDLLRDALRSLPAAAGPRRLETIVVDNRSSDGSADMVEREFPEVRLVRATENLGFAGANNLAFALARAPFVYCLNPDTVSHAGSIDTLASVLESDPRIGYAGPKLLNADGSHQLSAYRFHRLLSGFVSWSMLGLDGRFPYSPQALSLHHAYGCDARIQAEWLLGAAIMTRAETIRGAGGFDESYFLYAEEVEWCMRMHAHGWFGCYAPEAVVTHIRGASTSHLDHTHAFNGHNPRLLVESHRRLARQTMGGAGLVVSQAAHFAGVSLAWLRNLPVLPGADAAKRRKAALWMRYLLFPSSFRARPRAT